MPERRYEREDLADRGRGLAAAGAIVGGLLVAAFVVAGATTRLFGGEPPAGLEGAVPSDHLRQLRADVEAQWSRRADTWEWLDRGHSVARIPVSRAARLSLARGFPARQERRQPVTARGVR